ncbi:MAG: elongation factor Ts [Gammaproteobacteria bacterium]|jgi:elongation factor Ts|nr:elongation factor Ts [Gammaproteobacteria bacterium]
MTNIDASLVKELRERTGAGMMECKKALVSANGDIELAVEEMRKAGQAKADKKASRVAAEGVVIIKTAANGKAAAMVEVNCETDFVARDENFLKFANQAADAILESGVADMQALENVASHGSTVGELRRELISKIGENINVRRAEVLKTDGLFGAYIHSGRIGVVVELKGGDEALAKDIAMHVAAVNPLVVSQQDVPSDLVEKEKEIFIAQSKDSGKPMDIIEKMVQGRMKKFLDEVALLGQAFVKDPAMKVSDLLKSKGAQVVRFSRFAVGEGIEKQESDFVKEVMQTAKGNG